MLGMPGAGKSTIGSSVAELIEYGFIDLDEYIVKQQGMSHALILAQQGRNRLLELENTYTLGLNLNDTVFAPGGSIIYSKPAMEKLQDETHIIYLQVAMHQLRKRLRHTLDTRGIVGLESKPFEHLYHERHPLYKAAADSIIRIQRNTVPQVIDLVMSRLDTIDLTSKANKYAS